MFRGGYKRGVLHHLWVLEGAFCHGQRLGRRRSGARGSRRGSAEGRLAFLVSVQGESLVRNKGDVVFRSVVSAVGNEQIKQNSHVPGR